MHCVSGSETWGRAGSSIRDGIAEAHSGNRPDPWRQCGSSHPSPPTLCPRRSDIPPTPPLHSERPFASTSWTARLRSSKLRHRDAAGHRPGGDGPRPGRGRGADGGRRERARALGSADAGGSVAADSRARAVRGGAKPQRPVSPRPSDRTRRDERRLREPRQLPGLDQAKSRTHGSDPRLLDRANARKPQRALRGVGLPHGGLHARPRGGEDPGLRGGDPRDARDTRPSAASRAPSAAGRPRTNIPPHRPRQRARRRPRRPTGRDDQRPPRPPMVSGGVEVEIILGVQRDPVFGPSVMFELGGIFVEALKDATFRAAPFHEVEARAMIESIAAWPLLTGLRGQPPPTPPTPAPSPPPSPASPSSPPPTPPPPRASTSTPISSAPPAPSPSTPSSSPVPP